MNTEKEVLSLLDEILSLNGRSAEFTAGTPLLGAIPELDSMAVVALIGGLEERFGFAVEDDEIEGSTFATLGSLVESLSTANWLADLTRCSLFFCLHHTGSASACFTRRQGQAPGGRCFTSTPLPKK